MSTLRGMAEELFPMGVNEIAVRLGVTRQRAGIIAGRKDFPDPWRELARGKVWRSTDVERWVRQYRPDLVQ